MTEKLSLGTAELDAVDSSRSKVIHLDVQMNLNISQLAGVTSNHQSVAERGGYVLEVLSDSRRVDITGTTTSAVFYALQSLLSLLADSSDGRTLPTVCRLIVSLTSWIN